MLFFPFSKRLFHLPKNSTGIKSDLVVQNKVTSKVVQPLIANASQGVKSKKKLKALAHKIEMTGF